MISRDLLCCHRALGTVLGDALHPFNKREVPIADRCSQIHLFQYFQGALHGLLGFILALLLKNFKVISQNLEIKSKPAPTILLVPSKSCCPQALGQNAGYSVSIHASHGR